MSSRPVRLMLLAVACIATAMGLAGQTVAGDPYAIRVERVDVSAYPRVRLVASVVDGAGKPVKGLTPADLIVSEDGVPVTARVDLASETTPVALAFVIDASGSMAGAPLQEAVNATVAMTQRLGPRDQAALITFRETVDVLQPLSTDRSALTAAAGRIVPARDTPLASWPDFYEALGTAAGTLQSAPAGSRAVIVLVTDGFDRSTTGAQRDAAIAYARTSAYPIDVMGVGAQLDPSTLQRIADASRGSAFFAPSPAELAVAYAALSEQLLTQYAVSYDALPGSSPGAGREVHLQVVRGSTILADATVAYAVPASALPVTSPSSSQTVARDPVAAAGPDAASASEATEAVGAPAASSDPAVPVATLGAAAAFSLFLFVVNGILGPPARIRGRLDRFVPAPALGGASSEEAPRPRRRASLRPALLAVGQRLARITPSGMLTASGAQLEQAGSPLGLRAVEFLGLRTGCAIVSAVVLLACAWATGQPAELGLLVLIGGALLGFAMPGIAIRRVVKKRKKEIIRVLPATLDMIALSVEAGLAFDGAVAQVAQRRHNALSDEFRRLLVEFQMGRQRREALRELARRCDVPEVGRFMNSVMQADALGAPLSAVLADLALELRARRRQRAEELARTAPIKMLFPMVGLIFPALFVVILGPVVPRLLALFGSVGAR